MPYKLQGKLPGPKRIFANGDLHYRMPSARCKNFPQATTYGIAAASTIYSTL